MGKLRIEETPPTKPTLVVGRGAVAVQGAVPASPVAPREHLDAGHWRGLALATADRLQHAENQSLDLKKAADELRSRLAKANDRLDRANERVNALQVELVRVTADRDALRSGLSEEAKQVRALLESRERVARKVHQYRQSLLDGPIWDLFQELVTSPLPAGEEQSR